MTKDTDGDASQASIIGDRPSPEHTKIRQARQWRAKRFQRFADKQKTEGKYVCVADLIDRGGNIAFCQLLEWVRARKQAGKSRILLLHPWTYRVRMDKHFLENVLEVYGRTPFVVREQYLCRCWIPRQMAEEWTRKKSFDHTKGKSSRGRKKGGNKYDDGLYIGETTLFVAAGHSMRKAVKMAVKKLGWSGKIDTVINRVRKKYREGVRR